MASEIELFRELNRDVWHPFRQAYGALDVEALLFHYTPDGS